MIGDVNPVAIGGPIIMARQTFKSVLGTHGAKIKDVGRCCMTPRIPMSSMPGMHV